MQNLTSNQLKMEAKEAIECKLGFDVSRNDIILLEASGDGSYISFYRLGFNNIVYTARKKWSYEWELTIYNKLADDEVIL